MTSPCTRLLLLALLGLTAGCSSLPRTPRDKVPAALEKAKLMRAEGRYEEALRVLRSASSAKGLETSVRNEVQSELEATAQQRAAELAVGGDPESLVDLAELDLPRQIAVSAGIDGARQLFEKGKLGRALEVIESLDRRYPVHHERAAAGALVADIGFGLARRPPKTLGLFTNLGAPLQALDYLVLHYPTEARCDRAYAEMAELEELRGNLQIAIEHYESLLLYHAYSPLVPYAEAQIPHLRLAGHQSPEYDRESLRTSRRELEKWLERHEGGQLEDQVLEDLTDCILRTADAELGTARFYRTVSQDAGVRLHAEKALALAEIVENDRRRRAARQMIEALERGEEATEEAP